MAKNHIREIDLRSSCDPRYQDESRQSIEVKRADSSGHPDIRVRLKNPHILLGLCNKDRHTLRRVALIR